MSASAGRQKIAASTSIAIGTSGKPVRVFGYSQLSGAAGPGLVILYSGTDATGTEEFELTGTPNAGSQVSFGGTGKFFPGGCFAVTDANVTYIDVDYQQVQS